MLPAFVSYPTGFRVTAERPCPSPELLDNAQESLQASSGQYLQVKNQRTWECRHSSSHICHIYVQTWISQLLMGSVSNTQKKHKPSRHQRHFYNVLGMYQGTHPPPSSPRTATTASRAGTDLNIQANSSLKYNWACISVHKHYRLVGVTLKKK